MRHAWWLLICVGCATVDSDTAAHTDDSEIAVEGPDPDAVRACLAEAFMQRTCTGCHFDGTHLDLRFDALEELVTKNRELSPEEPLLIPGDPDNSLVVRKLEARAGLLELEPHEGGPMPADKEITEADAALIRAWVASGAPLPGGC